MPWSKAFCFLFTLLPLAFTDSSPNNLLHRQYLLYIHIPMNIHCHKQESFRVFTHTEDRSTIGKGSAQEVMQWALSALRIRSGSIWLSSVTVKDPASSSARKREKAENIFKVPVRSSLETLWWCSGGTWGALVRYSLGELSAFYLGMQGTLQTAMEKVIWSLRWKWRGRRGGPVVFTEVKEFEFRKIKRKLTITFT